jgi:hypothetical protein
MEPERRRSLMVGLTLFGLTGTVLAAPLIPEGQTVRRNLYGDRESCARDYSASQCEATGGGGTGGGGARGWRGPEYYPDRTQSGARADAGPGRYGSISTSAETSVRGGFGRVGRILRAVG